MQLTSAWWCHVKLDRPRIHRPVGKGFIAGPLWIEALWHPWWNKEHRISFAGEESQSTWNMRRWLEFPEGAHSQSCPVAQPARLALPCPCLPCPPAQRCLAAFPRLRRSCGCSCKALTGQYQTWFGPSPGLSEDPFPALMNCNTLCFPLASAPVQNAVCSLSCFGGTLTGGHWFHCVCGSPQPQEGGEIYS